MKLELTMDNGVNYLLRIPIELFNCNTKDFIMETLKNWLNDEIFEEQE